ncbi:unnamed protein product [Bursaphelenchus xylophilus]|uniref:(pine wood nematode) hypothetical protein n=1 Tax=Bursaphelenchus xylophilus TaxID=6326 RepID=A0A1I7STJ2_BURXY|nr:unnamed protein product [Bursaphelenchus xylophilus]CAG9108348.1 unnamed protein product [Bursaphelenchus xylophilus]
MKVTLLCCLSLSLSPYLSAVPTPLINLHEGFIGLNDRFMEPPYFKPIAKNKAYTLEIFMGNVDEFDYMVDYCVANNIRFMDSYGCLRPDNVFSDYLETEQYTRPGAVKRTLVHFYPQDVFLNIECVITVFSCSGCAEHSCHTHPRIRYPNFTMPIRCSYPVSQPYALPPTQPYPIVPPAPPAPSPPLPYPLAPPPIPVPGPQRCERCLWGLPWWLWLIFFILLLILLCLIISLCLCCLLRRRRRTRLTENTVPHKEIYTIEKGIQAEKLSDSSGLTRRELDRHGSVRLINEHPSINNRSRRSLSVDRHHQRSEETRRETGEEQRRLEQMRRDERRDQMVREQRMREQAIREERSREQAARRHGNGHKRAGGAAYDNHQFDVYEEDGMERVVTESRVFYENYPPTTQTTEISAERSGESYVSPHPPSIHLQLQRELQDNQRMRQRREPLEEYREDGEEIRNARSYRNRPIHHSNEALREETVRTMRQSSVI